MCPGTSLLAVGTSSSGGKTIRNMDGDIRAEVTESGGRFIGDWTMPSNLANSISSYVRVGFLSVFDSASPELTPFLQSYCWFALMPPVCRSVCCDLLLFLLDFVLLGPSLPPHSISSRPGSFPVISSFESLGVLLPLRAVLHLEVFLTACSLSRARLMWSLPVVDSTCAASSLPLRSSAKLNHSTSPHVAHLGLASSLQKPG